MDKELMFKKLDQMVRFYVDKLEPELIQHFFAHTNIDTLNGAREIYDQIMYWSGKDAEERKEVMDMFGIKVKKMKDDYEQSTI